MIGYSAGESPDKWRHLLLLAVWFAGLLVGAPAAAQVGPLQPPPDGQYMPPGGPYNPGEIERMQEMMHEMEGQMRQIRDLYDDPLNPERREEVRRLETVNRALIDQRERQMRMWQAQSEQRYPLNGTRINLEDEEQEGFGWLPIVGLFLLGVVAITLLLMQRRPERLAKPADSATAAAIRKAATGPQTPDELGEALLEALRFGHYPEFVVLFLTKAQANRLYGPTRARFYWTELRAPSVARETFAELRQRCAGEGVTLAGTELGASVPMTVAMAPEETVRAAAFRLHLVTAEGAAQAVPLGAVVELASGWRLLALGRLARDAMQSAEPEVAAPGFFDEPGSVGSAPLS
jgi:hypothetical protein